MVELLWVFTKNHTFSQRVEQIWTKNWWVMEKLEQNWIRPVERWPLICPTRHADGKGCFNLMIAELEVTDKNRRQQNQRQHNWFTQAGFGESGRQEISVVGDICRPTASWGHLSGRHPIFHFDQEPAQLLNFKEKLFFAFLAYGWPIKFRLQHLPFIEEQPVSGYVGIKFKYPEQDRQ